MDFLSWSFYRFVNIARYFLIQGMTNSIIVVKGRLTYLVSLMKYSRSAFFNSQKIDYISYIVIVTLFHLFLLQKGIKRRSADGMTDKDAKQTLKEFRNVETQTTGVAEE